MDVHAPHEPIHSVRDFFLHLFTITVGLLIALGLEALVERVHHKHLEGEARAEIRAEVEGNRNDLEDVMKTYSQQQVVIDDLLQLCEAQRQRSKAPDVQHLAINFEGATLNTASYATAQSDGALSLMSYEEAKKYADVYELQAEFMSEQRETFEHVASPLFGTMQSKIITLAHMDASQLDHEEELLQTYNGNLEILTAISTQLDATYKKL